MPQQIYSASSTTFTSSSSSSSTNGTTSTQTGQAQSMYTTTDPTTGQTTVHTASQNLGEPVVRETQTLDSRGNLIAGGSRSGSEAGVARVRDVTEEEAQAQSDRDREYEERMEDEYAKREGGA